MNNRDRIPDPLPNEAAQLLERSSFRGKNTVSIGDERHVLFRPMIGERHGTEKMLPQVHGIDQAVS